jgi:ADP-heptose:LPS heptosyltransferase
MNILLYLFAGNGDLINTTGVIKQLKLQYPDIQINFLLKIFIKK